MSASPAENVPTGRRRELRCLHEACPLDEPRMREHIEMRDDVGATYWTAGKRPRACDWPHCFSWYGFDRIFPIGHIGRWITKRRDHRCKPLPERKPFMTCRTCNRIMLHKDDQP